jgi:hypothetical protein
MKPRNTSIWGSVWLMPQPIDEHMNSVTAPISQRRYPILSAIQLLSTRPMRKHVVYVVSTQLASSNDAAKSPWISGNATPMA